MGFDSYAEFTTAPYPGLRPFEPEEQDIFFGREKQTDRLLEKLQTARFLAVVGPSGCGKSSLVRAGLIPALKTGFMAAAGTRWAVASMRPGNVPFERLATTIVQARLVGEARDNVAAFVKAGLRRGPLGLVEAIGESGVCERTNVLLLVDQFEELFRYETAAARDESDAFVAMLLETASQRDLPIYVVITMRSEYIDRCAEFPGLAEAVSDSQYLTPRLSREECARAISGPARVFGGEVDRALVERLLNDFGPAPDQLPVLQHALMRMWTMRKAAAADGDGKIVLTVDDYKRIGGLASALSNHANEALGELSAERRQIAKVLFKRLSCRTAGKLDTRSPASVAQIAKIADVEVAEVTTVADAFLRADRCLLTRGEREPLTGDSVLDVSHESLLRCWDTVRGWIDEEAEWAATYRRLKEDAELWSVGRAALWGSPNLDNAIAWRDRARPNAAWAARYGKPGEFERGLKFIEASERKRQNAQEEEHRKVAREQSLRRVQRVAWVAGPVAALAVAFAFIYFFGYVRQTPKYFETISQPFGKPKGLGKLSEDQVGHRPSSLRIWTKGFFGRVVKFEAINAERNPTTVHESFNPFEIEGTREATDVSWEISYDENGRVVTVQAFDERHQRVWGIGYLRDQQATDRARLYALPSRAITDTPGTAPPAGRLLEKGMLVAVTYGSNGYETERRYQDAVGHPKRWKDGAFGRTSKFDDDGRPIRFTSIDSQGEPMFDSWGRAMVEMVYKDDHKVEEHALDPNKQPTTVFDGWSIQRFEYDHNGNLINRSYFDAGGHKAVSKDGYHGATSKRDDRGNEESTTFIGTNGEHVSNKQGCFGYKFTYDSDGRPLSKTCQDAGGSTMLDNMECASTVSSYDDHGRLIRKEWRDVDAGLCAPENDIATIFNEYDQNSMITSYFDANGKPAFKDGYASEKRTFDASGNCSSVEYLGGDHKSLVLSTDGYAKVEWSRDEFGNILEESYYGPTNQRVLDNRSRTAGWRARYDASGNEVERTFYGLLGENTTGPDGFSGWRVMYDEMGNMKETKYIDATGKPVQDSTGVAGWRSKFKQGREVQRMYVDTRGRPKSNTCGVAGYRLEYDEHGNQNRIDYLSTNSGLALYSCPGNETLKGYASILTKYDQRGNEIERSYLGTKGEPVLGEKGFARAVGKVDGRGRPIEIRYWASDKKKASVGQDRIHLIMYGYNDRARTTLACSFDVNDHYLNHETRMHGIHGTPIQDNARDAKRQCVALLSK